MTHTLDTVDRKILNILQTDATRSVDDISSLVALSRNACWRRIKQMEAAGVIKSRVALVDPAIVGCGLQVLVMIRTSAHDAKWIAGISICVKNNARSCRGISHVGRSGLCVACAGGRCACL